MQNRKKLRLGTQKRMANPEWISKNCKIWNPRIDVCCHVRNIRHRNVYFTLVSDGKIILTHYIVMQQVNHIHKQKTHRKCWRWAKNCMAQWTLNSNHLPLFSWNVRAFITFFSFFSAFYRFSCYQLSHTKYQPNVQRVGHSFFLLFKCIERLNSMGIETWIVLHDRDWINKNR